MDDKNINIEELIVRVLENRADSEDIRYFSKWVEEIRNREYFEKLKKIWNLSAGGHANSEILEIGVRDFRLFMEKIFEAEKACGIDVEDGFGCCRVIDDLVFGFVAAERCFKDFFGRRIFRFFGTGSCFEIG